MVESSGRSILGRHQFCFEQRIEILPHSIERYHSLQYTPRSFYSEGHRDENWKITYENVYASPRLPAKISFEDIWTKELGSEVAGHLEISQQTQPNIKNSCKHGETCDE